MSRFSVRFAFLDRPLVQSLVWGVLFGHMPVAVATGIVFELFWLDRIPVGTYIPPNNTAANTVALTAVYWGGFFTASEALFPVVFALPVASIARKLEGRIRLYNNRLYERLQKAVKAGSDNSFCPGQLLTDSIILHFVVFVLFFVVCSVALIACIHFSGQVNFLRLPHTAGIADITGITNVTWGHLWIAAAAAGTRSLRTPLAYRVLAVSALTIAVLLLLLELW